MSLVGNLEDLGLGDILQIVSLSRKSGVLTLRNRGRDGRIVFLHGRVIQASSSVSKETLGDILLRKGLISSDSLRKALHQQRQMDSRVPLGSILCEHFGISREAVEALLREQVETIVYSFFGWTEGTFSFDLGEPTDLAATHLDPLQFMLDQGLNPCWFALGGRQESENRQPGNAETPSYRDESVGFERCRQQFRGSSTEPLPRGRVLLIDDDQIVCERIEKVLRDRGLSVAAFSDSGRFMHAAEVEMTEGIPPILLIDLIMPRENGDGMLGGYELFEKVRCKIPDARVMIMTDLPSPEVERRIEELGAFRVLSKPKARDLSSGEGVRALGVLADAVCLFAKEKCSLTHFDLGAELFQEFGDAPDVPVTGFVASPGLHLLKGMLQELHNPSLGGGIILLVLRFASEFMNRAVIFSVKEKEIIGLGQFGIEVFEGNPDARVRAMRFPVDEPSPFTPVLVQGIPTKVKPGNGRWDTYLHQSLGGGEPDEIFLGPIVSEGKTVAVLYGDNLPRKCPVGDTEPLEIFLSQAGMAMEKALLERRLHGINVN